MSDFKNELEQEVEFINDLISRYLPDETGLDKKIREAMNYSVNAGGKRVRPMLMLEVYKLCGGDDCQVVYPFMAALECIHSYSLVHDDLPAMDNDDYRRGRLTTHKVFGEDFGILAGDGLLNLAYEIMAEALISGEGDMTAKAKAMEVIARKAGIKGMVGGQAVDVELTGKALSDEQLDFIFRLKTGALIEAAFLAGAYLAPFMYGLFWKGVTKAACMASFIAGVGITVIHMAYYTLAGHTGTLWGINLASPINAGAFAMLFGLVLVPIVSLITRQSDADKAHAEKVFECYNDSEI